MKIASKPNYQSLSISAIENSNEIQSWLLQFSSDSERAIAKTLLSRLKFVSRDEYSHWLRNTLEELPVDRCYALYSVRKIESQDDEDVNYWALCGKPIDRPAAYQGSEDLVYSLISNIVRSNGNRFLDHPTIDSLKSNTIRDIILIDDSIGSGDRVSGFINLLLKHPTLLSWWSFGWIKITIVAFARPYSSDQRIIDSIIGSDHGKRKFRKSVKVSFVSELVYDKLGLESRWGSNYKRIAELCQKKTGVAKWARFGYGHVFSNIIFFHSVPNNIPGILWFSNKKWTGIFEGRALPFWTIELLNKAQKGTLEQNTSTAISNDLLLLLSLVKKGVRSISNIAIRLNVDIVFAQKLVAHALTLGMLTRNTRLTKFGLDKLKERDKVKEVTNWDYSMYIPNSWCSGPVTIQPPNGEKLSLLSPSVDSTEAVAAVAGGVGETPLERSDAKAAEPPFSVMPQLPSEPRESHDSDGPQSSKDR